MVYTVLMIVVVVGLVAINWWAVRRIERRDAERYGMAKHMKRNVAGRHAPHQE